MVRAPLFRGVTQRWAAGFLRALGFSAVNYCAARLNRVSSRFIKLKQDLEPNHISSKTYLEFLNAKRKILRR